MTVAEAITQLWNAIISGLTEVPMAIVNAIKELFVSFVFDNYGEETQAISFMGYFLFAVLGLNLVPLTCESYRKSREPIYYRVCPVGC